MSARNRARRIQLTAYEYITEVWRSKGYFAKTQAIVLTNQHKIERTYKLSGEYLAEIKQLLTKCQPGDEHSRILLEVQSSFELIRQTIDSIPANARPHSPKRETILSLYWKAQDSLFKVRLALAD